MRKLRVRYALMACAAFLLLAFCLFPASWDGEREVVPLGQPATIQVIADKPESGITVRVEGRLKGSARVVLPQFKMTFLPPEQLNAEFLRCGWRTR